MLGALAKQKPSDRTAQAQAAMLVRGNLNILDQLTSGLDAIEDKLYVRQPDHSGSSIGMHMRHAIEFYQELLKALNAKGHTALCYDKRQRQLDLETSKHAAQRAIRDIQNTLTAIDLDDLDLDLDAVVDPAQPMVRTKTTVHREMFYVLDHATHHMALIKMIAQSQNVTFDENFGLAQSTQKHLKTQKA